MGHMHDFGSYYGVDWNKSDGTDELVYSVEEWTVDQVEDYPKITYYEPGDIVVQPGDEFTTHCEWYNPTDEVLPNPAEMCTTVIVAYPMETIDMHTDCSTSSLLVLRLQNTEPSVVTSHMYHRSIDGFPTTLLWWIWPPI